MFLKKRSQANACTRNLASFSQVRLNLSKGTSVNLILKV